MAAKSLLFAEDQVLTQPPACGPCRQEVTATVQKDGRLYTITIRDTVVVEDPYFVLVKAAAFAISQNEPYMGRSTPRSVKDFLIKSNVVV